MTYQVQTFAYHEPDCKVIEAVENEKFTGRSEIFNIFDSLD